MRKKLFLIIGVTFIIALLALLTIFLRNSNNVETTPKSGPVVVEGVGVPEGRELSSGVGTLRELQAREGSLECQIVLDQPSGIIEGTYFSDKGNVRADFLVPAAEFGGTILSSMIVGGDSMYVWSVIDGQAFGFKTNTSNGMADTVGTREPVSLDAQIRYTCGDWENVDGSVFIPPADVQFQDVNAVIDAGMEYGTF